MTLADLSIKRPVFAWMLFWGILLFGAISFQKLGISQMPDVDFPVINIKLSLPGASPSIMETNVVDILEDSLLTVEGVIQINSTSSTGQASITVELDLSRNVDAAFQEVQTKVVQAQKLLPINLDPPLISKYNPEDTPIIWIAVTHEGHIREQMVYVRDILKNEFSVVPGVGQIQLGGFADRNLRVWVDGKKLSLLEITVEDLINAIRREHVEDPAGLLENREIQRNLRSMGEALNLEEFGQLRIPNRGGSPIFEKVIRIRDLAELEDGLEDRMRISRLNGTQAVGIGIIKQRGTNAVEVARLVKEKAKALEASLPEGMKLHVSFDTTVFIEESIEELEFTLALSVLLTALVCFLFLGNWSSTWNILLSIPTSIIGSFFVMSVFGFTLNTFTLLALSLAIGIVVDDAIMVLENIVRHAEEGESRMLAARKGAREITFAAVATTLSIAAIFLPVVFMSGVIGKYFFQFGVVISGAVFLSLLEALTLTPMRASKYLQLSTFDGRFTKILGKIFKKIDEIYETTLRISLNHRIKVILFSLVFFLGSVASLFWIKKEFVPSMDQSRVIVRIQGPIGVSVPFMDELSRVCEEKLQKEPEVLRVFTAVGGFQGGQSNLANFMVTLKQPEDRPIREGTKKPLSQKQFAKVIRKILVDEFPDLKVSVQDLSTRGFSSSRGYPVEISIQGPDWDLLAESSLKIQEAMKASPYFSDVDSSFTEGAPEILIFPKREATSRYGVNMESIGTVLSAMVGGLRVAQFTQNGKRYDIRVRLKPDERQKVEQIKNLLVRNQRGELVPLENLVEFREEASLTSITRENRARSINLFANPGLGYGQNQSINEAEKIALSILPKGYFVKKTGSSKTFADSFQSLYFALFFGVIVAYMILASQFNSFSQPIVVLIALPFSFSGAIFSLWIFGYSLNIFSFIALLLLMGLVKKNSIMLVDFTNQRISKGESIGQALRNACPTRLRPILMTSVATIAAAIPPALAIGPGAESRIPMAIAVIGGMLVSTILTLYVVPATYSLFYEKR
jgi:hydrophobe/amphiphile efflux-1 (HAE1) family protein